MLGILDSSRVVVAIVVGIPLAVGVVVALGLYRQTPTAVVALSTLLIVAVVGVSAWALARKPAPQATVAAPPAPSVTPSSPPSSPPPPTVPSPTPSPSAACSPNGTSLQETAQNITYQSTCLAASANQDFTISFDNKDAGTMHNMHVYSDDPLKDPNATSFFMGQIITGPATATYSVSALPAGTYFFHCDVHPTQMFGTLVVGG